MQDSLFDPEAFRQAGHRLIDDLADYLGAAGQGDMPVLPHLPPRETANRFQDPPPAAGSADPAGTFAELTRQILAGSNHLHHPGYVGHQVAPPLPLAALADLLGGLLNQGMGVYEMGPLATQIEQQTVRWLCGLVGWGTDGGGVFTSGGSLGNLTALLVARNRAAGGQAWRKGVAAERPLVILASEHAHYSVERAAGILGLGTDAVVKIPCDRRYRMNISALERAYVDMIRTGRQVMAVVASACSTATGSYDPLGAIGAFCREYGLWFHVDGAHGASALLSPAHAFYMDGVPLADSLVWDAHKMLYVPALATAVLFREGRLAYDAFDQNAAYLFQRSAEDDAFNLGLRTVECTKRMLAWKLWAVIRIYGTETLGRLVGQVYDLTRQFDRLLRAQPDFEVLMEPMSNILCFRYRPAGMTPDDEGLNALQRTLRQRVIAGGEFYLVQTTIGDRTWLRVTLMNPHTTIERLQRLIETIRQAASA